jgi:lipoprotein-releasing system ATP-binding protein
MSEEPVLHLEAVCKSYNEHQPNEIEVLHSIDLSIEAGGFCALIGPSGSGKSTLLNVIGLLDRASSGRVLVSGQDTTQLNEAGLTALRGRSIGFVFQYHHLISAFTALENVMMPMLLDRRWPSAEIRATATSLIDKVGLARWKDNPAHALSGGQQQRVAIARALAMKAPLILADEPTGNLDTKSANQVFELMRQVNRESDSAFLIITHNLELARRTDRIVELVDGRIVSGGAIAT